MKDGAIQPSRLDEVCEIAHRDDESERLVAARARKRAALLASTERELEKARASVEAGRLRDPGKIGPRAGRVLNRHKRSGRLSPTSSSRTRAAARWGARPTTTVVRS